MILPPSWMLATTPFPPLKTSSAAPGTLATVPPLQAAAPSNLLYVREVFCPEVAGTPPSPWTAARLAEQQKREPPWSPLRPRLLHGVGAAKFCPQTNRLSRLLPGVRRRRLVSVRPRAASSLPAAFR
jgi:hypothetical protein